jgi:hypothetical protein
MSKETRAILITIAVLAILLWVVATFFKGASKGRDVAENLSIDSFEECVAAGNPVMESFQSSV